MTMLKLLRQTTSSNIMLHNCLLAMVIIGFILPALTLALTANPIVGDLTRLGYLPEEEFGWHKPQVRYEKSHFSKIFPKRQYDIIVLGDSFSLDEKRSWVNTLVSQTGLSVGVSHHRNLNLFDLGNADEIGNPRLIIFETAERRLLDRTQLCEQPLVVHNSAAHIAGISIKQVLKSPATTIEYRPVKVDFLNIPLGYYVKKMFSPYLDPNLQERVQLVTLKSNYFSNSRSKELLYYSADNKKKQWPATAPQEIQCGVATMRRFSADVLKANFLLMVMPDKSSIYGNYAVRKGISSSRLEGLFDESDVLYVDLYAELKRLVQQGTVDVYLPNDTHISGRTQKHVGNLVVKYLMWNGVLTNFE
ncbi:MAG: hypothetical protein CL896_06125 [Dehalococcoidia bacterium]|nr:hypothetical protein [Dehalococcoidia bacterium]